LRIQKRIQPHVVSLPLLFYRSYDYSKFKTLDHMTLIVLLCLSFPETWSGWNRLDRATCPFSHPDCRRRNFSASQMQLYAYQACCELSGSL